MIHIFTEPSDWKDLQNKVCTLLSQSGFNAVTEKKVQTPRGEVELDVFAIDPNSIDQISYIIECKNWSSPVNQAVVHSFMTVMNETGSNIGYIVSQNGFQSGARKYTDYTNIKLFTFNELQTHYYKSWMKNYFSPLLEEYIDRCNNYVEPCNNQRDKGVEELNQECKERFFTLYKKYGGLIQTLSLISTSINYMMKVHPDKDYTNIQWDKFIAECGKCGLNLNGLPLLEILNKLRVFIKLITAEFDCLFDGDIFA